VKRDIYEAITERFIEQLKRGTVPWKKPWFAVQNIVSRRPYRGINALLLGSADYQSPLWISFRQALDLGGQRQEGREVHSRHLLQDQSSARALPHTSPDTSSNLGFEQYQNRRSKKGVEDVEQ
jgi:antirestriction protein ArdC